MYKVGMYGGSFNPLHLGHVNNIVMATNMCEKLYIVLCNSYDEFEIDHKERLMWIKTITSDMENVEVFEEFADNTIKNKYDWKKGRDYILNYINKKIDVVFCGDDYKGRNIFENLYPESIIHYFSRNEIKISSTEIRSDPYKYFEYLPDIVKEYYTKKVVIVGTESCGKSTLVRNLAKVYNTGYVEEVGRIVCDEAGGIDNMQPKHYYDILIKHKALENEKIKTANKVLFIDTDSLITLYYYKLGFDNNKYFENIASSMAELSNYDLYIFLESDVKWIQDGTRTYGENEIRKKNNVMLKEMLRKRNIDYKIVDGDYQERFIKAKKLVNTLLNK